MKQILKTMEMNNEIRRIKAKLKLFEEEGFSWLANDLLDAKTPWQENSEIIEEIRLELLEQLEKLSPPDIKQTKLEL